MLCCIYERKFVHTWTQRALLVPPKFAHAHRTGEPHGLRGLVEVAAAFLGDGKMQYHVACASKVLNFERIWLDLREGIA